MASSKRKTSHDSNGSVIKRKTVKTEIEQLKISSAYTSEKFLKLCSDSFKDKRSSYNDEQLKWSASHEPFHHCCLPNFLDNDNFLRRLKEELSDIDFTYKNNDLYKFSQSDNFKNLNVPYVNAIRKIFEGEILDWMKNLTGIELEETVDLSASRYNYTDVLLCHDDELEGRRIAFILYLVPKWSKADGGTLDLFAEKKIGQPATEPSCSILPQWNTLVFFEVTQQSFHQVSEVLSEEKCRLSLSGWFHGPCVERKPRDPLTPDTFDRPISLEGDELMKWINPSYFDVSSLIQIRTKFEEDSEIELNNFLITSVYQEIRAELEESTLTWEMLSPPNQRRLEEAINESLPPKTRECILLFQSEPFYLFLSSLTGLVLHPFFVTNSDNDHQELELQETQPQAAREDGTTASSCVKLNRWRHGSYTLITDQQSHECQLDLKLFFNCAGWDEEFGGFVSYVTKNEDEELLTVVPNDNSLSLVYRDAETVGFVKYINQQIKEINHKGEFYCVNGIYKE